MASRELLTTLTVQQGAKAPCYRTCDKFAVLYQIRLNPVQTMLPTMGLHTIVIHSVLNLRCFIIR